MITHYPSEDFLFGLPIIRLKGRLELSTISTEAVVARISLQLHRQGSISDPDLLYCLLYKVSSCCNVVLVEKDLALDVILSHNPIQRISWLTTQYSNFKNLCELEKLATVTLHLMPRPCFCLRKVS
jgi:hypothetical protein